MKKERFTLLLITCCFSCARINQSNFSKRKYLKGSIKSNYSIQLNEPSEPISKQIIYENELERINFNHSNESENEPNLKNDSSNLIERKIKNKKHKERFQPLHKIRHWQKPLFSKSINKNTLKRNSDNIDSSIIGAALFLIGLILLIVLWSFGWWWILIGSLLIVFGTTIFFSALSSNGLDGFVILLIGFIALIAVALTLLIWGIVELIKWLF